MKQSNRRKMRRLLKRAEARLRSHVDDRTSSSASPVGSPRYISNQEALTSPVRSPQHLSDEGATTFLSPIREGSHSSHANRAFASPEWARSVTDLDDKAPVSEGTSQRRAEQYFRFDALPQELRCQIISYVCAPDQPIEPMIGRVKRLLIRDDLRLVLGCKCPMDHFATFSISTIKGFHHLIKFRSHKFLKEWIPFVARTVYIEIAPTRTKTLYQRQKRRDVVLMALELLLQHASRICIRNEHVHNIVGYLHLLGKCATSLRSIEILTEPQAWIRCKSFPAGWFCSLDSVGRHYKGKDQETQTFQVLTGEEAGALRKRPKIRETNDFADVLDPFRSTFVRLRTYEHLWPCEMLVSVLVVCQVTTDPKVEDMKVAEVVARRELTLELKFDAKTKKLISRRAWTGNDIRDSDEVVDIASG